MLPMFLLGHLRKSLFSGCAFAYFATSNEGLNYAWNSEATNAQEGKRNPPSN